MKIFDEISKFFSSCLMWFFVIVITACFVSVLLYHVLTNNYNLKQKIKNQEVNIERLTSYNTKEKRLRVAAESKLTASEKENQNQKEVIKKKGKELKRVNKAKILVEKKLVTYKDSVNQFKGQYAKLEKKFTALTDDYEVIELNLVDVQVRKEELFVKNEHLNFELTNLNDSIIGLVAAIHTLEIAERNIASNNFWWKLTFFVFGLIGGICIVFSFSYIRKEYELIIPTDFLKGVKLSV